MIFVYLLALLLLEELFSHFQFLLDKSCLSLGRLCNLISSLQERMKSSKKLVPRLFGVNKESIVRVDEKTKEVLQVRVSFLAFIP